DLIAYYLAADVAAVTPLRDGMNLVAKEFCAARFDAQGALVLSEFAGAADELRLGALIVNPYDVGSFADVLHRALCMGESEQAFRMDAMRLQIESHDVYRWADLFASDCWSATEFAGAGIASSRGVLLNSSKQAGTRQATRDSARVTFDISNYP